MDGPFHLPPVGSVAAARGRIVGAMNLDYVSAGILDDTRASDQVPITQPDLAVGRQPEILLGRVLAKIVVLDVQHTGEGNLPSALARVLGIVDRFHVFHLTLGIVVDDHAQRP